MRQPGPSISRLETWSSWESFCLECLQRALINLSKIKNLPADENSINSKLHTLLRVAAHEIRPTGFYSLIGYECPPQPYGDDDDESTRRLKPTPDFTWGFVDHRDPDPTRNARELAIECKRLRAPSSSWNYNENYVKNGISRFLDEEKKYGISVPSGVMVGYWQGMGCDEILKEINAAAFARKIPIIILSQDGWKTNAISQLDHLLIRAFPESPYSLRHLWVDLRPQKNRRLRTQ